jgi:type I restriction enzyme S subunit
MWTDVKNKRQTVEELPHGWQMKRLQSFCAKIGTGATPRGGKEVYLDSREHHALIRSQNVFDRHFDTLGLAFISETHAQELRNAEVQCSDVLLNITGDGVTFGRACIVPESVLPACVNQHVSIIRTDNNQCDPGYLLSFLTLPLTKRYIESFNSGGSRRAITKGHIESFEVPLPPLCEQKAIAQILGALDEKIELNQRMHATLETMARALFQSWFIDFDPVNAKLGGRLPVGLDKPMAALFPARFQESSFDPIPHGWEVRSLDKIANYLNGLALQKYPPGDGPTLPVIKIAQLRKGDSDGADRCNTELATEYIVEDGDVLFSWSGSLEVELWCGGPGALNQHLFKVTSSEFPKWFYYLWTLYHLDEFRHIAAGKATTMGHIQRCHLTAARVLVPPSALIEAMTRLMAPLVEQIIANRIQSRTLATLRDTLLPKLLSGELRVGQMEQATPNIVPFPVQASKSPSKKTTDEFVEAVVIAQLVRKLATPEHPLGRKRYNKFAYLAHRKADEDVSQHYLKKAAGPYSPWAKYGGPEKIAEKNGYVEQGKAGVFTGLVVGKKIEEIDRYLPNYPVCAAIDWIVEKFRFKKNDDLELLATVDFAALDLRGEGKPLTREMIKQVILANKEWAPKLDRAIFSDTNVDRALAELATLFPATYQS